MNATSKDIEVVVEINGVVLLTEDDLEAVAGGNGLRDIMPSKTGTGGTG